MKNIPPKIDFKAKQAEFAAYIRDPIHNPAPKDIKKSRMVMYRQLFFNNIEGFLSGNFPVIRCLLSDDAWLALVQDFFLKHASSTPYFSEIPEEFLNYLENERSNPTDLPFLLELAHYEWVEMVLSIAKDNIINHDEIGDVLKYAVQLSPLAWPLVYRYPVHNISPAYMPLIAPEQPTFLIVYRNKDDDVHFIETTPMTYRLLETVQEHGNEGVLAEHCLLQIAKETGSNPELIIKAGISILSDLANKHIIVLKRYA